jgi:HEAT repeat protein
MRHAALLLPLAAGIGLAQPLPPDHPQPTPPHVQPGGALPTTPRSTAWDVLKQGIADSDEQHRKSAITAAGTLGSMSEGVKLVAGGLKDKDTSVRQTAAATLGEMDSKDAIPYLRAALDDSPQVIFTAAQALWKLGDTSSREIFQEVLEGERKDGPGKMHTMLHNAKKKLTPGQLALMGVSEASGLLGPAGMGIEAVQEALKEMKGSNKDAAVPGRAVAASILAKDPDPYALTLLEWSIGDGNWAVRLAVAKGLGERGNHESIPKLTPLLNDDRHAVRYMAAASIIKLEAKNATAGGE